MVDVVYTKTDSYRDRYERDKLHLQGETVIERKWSIFSHLNKVALAESVLVTGVRRNKSSYWYWRTISSMGFFTNKAGNVQPYHARRKLSQKSQWEPGMCDYVFNRLDPEYHSVEMNEKFTDEVKFRFGINNIYDLYPLAEKWGIGPYMYNAIPYNLRLAMREDEWKDFAAAAYGKTRVTKPLLKVLPTSVPFSAAVAGEFRGKAANNVLASFIENNSDYDVFDSFSPFSPNMRRIVRLMTPETADSLLQVKMDMTTISRINRIGTLSKINAKVLAGMKKPEDVTKQFYQPTKVSSFKNVREWADLSW